MKRILIIPFISLILFSCNTTEKKTNNNIDTLKYTNTKDKNVIGENSENEDSLNTEKMKGEIFFEYDKIEYYFNNFKGVRHLIYENRNKSKLDSLKWSVLFGNTPQNISDISFIGKLNKIGYQKSLIETSQFVDIDNIFVEKVTKDNVATGCIYIYRDILVFKKNERIVGIAKVCFECMANQIIGTIANTTNFGQDGDYDRLKKLLRK